MRCAAGERTVLHIAWKHGLHPNQASLRKHKASEKPVELFERRPKAGLEPQRRLPAVASLTKHARLAELGGTDSSEAASDERAKGEARWVRRSTRLWTLRNERRSLEWRSLPPRT